MKHIEGWITFIERSIKESTTTGEDGERTATLEWLTTSIRNIYEQIPEGEDGNMCMAGTLSLILAAWFSRITYAKSMDKRRPLKQRKILKAARINYIKEMNKLVRKRKPLITPSMEPMGVDK